MNPKAEHPIPPAPEPGRCAPRQVHSQAHRPASPLQPVEKTGPHGRRPSAIEAKVPPRRLLSIKEVQAVLGVSYWCVRDLIDTGALRMVRLPLGNKELRKVLVRADDLDRLIENSTDEVI